MKKRYEMIRKGIERLWRVGGKSIAETGGSKKSVLKPDPAAFMKIRSPAF